MSLRRDTHANIRTGMQPGDVIAFSGRDLISELIRLVTDSEEISHVEVVLASNLSVNGGPQDDRFNLVAEANASGVRIISLYSLQSEYNGEIWWLPLSLESRKRLQPNLEAFRDFLFCEEGRRYNFEGALIEGLRELIGEQNLLSRFGNWLLDLLGVNNNQVSFVDRLIEDPDLRNIENRENIRSQLVNSLIRNCQLEEIQSEEDARRYFCSELVTQALQLGGVFADANGIDPETINPIELCQFRIYADCVPLASDDSSPVIEGFNTITPV